jgi:cob(I)alamin adenosyltransferase
VSAPTEDPRPDDLHRAPSVVIVNTGDGKGKSSAAFGVMIRAVARGWPVAVVQFIKSGKWHVGEEKIGRQLGVEWFNVGDGFTWDSADLDHDKALAREGWENAAALIAAGAHRLVILDEITYLCTWGWIDTTKVAAAIRDRPEQVNVVVTGRDAPPELVEVADTVTEMRKVKHAYDRGVNAIRGIEY